MIGGGKKEQRVSEECKSRKRMKCHERAVYARGGKALIKAAHRDDTDR